MPTRGRRCRCARAREGTRASEDVGAREARRGGKSRRERAWGGARDGVRGDSTAAASAIAIEYATRRSCKKGALVFALFVGFLDHGPVVVGVVVGVMFGVVGGVMFVVSGVFSGAMFGVGVALVALVVRRR